MAGIQSASQYPSQDNDPPILNLPNEILQLITSLLPNRDVKSLRLTNRRLSSASILHIERVFISPSYKNIEVLHGVVGCRDLCTRVKELVWDDARFLEYTANSDEGDDGSEYSVSGGPGNFTQFKSDYEKSPVWISTIEAARVRAGIEVDTDAAEDFMSLDQCFALYIQLYEEQEEIIRTGLDVAALREGLSAFPALERVTITSDAHRYPTPMVRLCPLDFNYPRPWSWWNPKEPYEFTQPWSHMRERWRGFPIVLEALASCDRAIPELVINANSKATGISQNFFEPEFPDFDNFETICGRGLRRLEFSFNVPSRGEFKEPLVNRLKETLAMASSMGRFTIHTSPPRRFPLLYGKYAEVLSMIPLEAWPFLRHLSISHLPIASGDLLNFLRRLPPTLKLVEFVDLTFSSGTWAGLLPSFKDDLRWKANRPQIAIGHSLGTLDRKLWVRDEVAVFLDGGENPFVGMFDGNHIQWGFGTIRDDIDDVFRNPWTL